MDFATTPEQDRLVAEVTEFGREELSRRAADNDREARFDAQSWSACAKFGVLGWPVPARYGGAGLDPLTLVLALEALGYGCRDNGLLFAVNNHICACVSYLIEHGDAAQRARWLPGLSDGTVVGAHALTEPGAGSDMLAITTAARRDGDGYRLTGVKTYISNAPIAGLFVVFARTDATAPPQRSLSAFLVPGDAPGLTVTRTLTKTGLRGSPMGELRLDGVPVPAGDRLGGEGDGYQIFTRTADWERGYLVASQVGTLRRLVETAAGHATRRRQFDQPIAAFQAVAHRIADMRVNLELARLLLYRFGWLKQQGRLAIAESSMLKLFVSESLVRAALDTQRIHGARGYLADGDIEREVRDALAGPVYAGTNDVHRTLIAASFGGGDG